MPSFEAMFIESKGKPIQYQGKMLVLTDRLPTQGARLIRLTFEQCNAEWRQGVSLICDGQLRVNGRLFEGREKGMGLWQDTAPATVDLELVGSVRELEVHNVWDCGDGTIHYWHNGAAMIVEELPTGRRYRCNDGEADDDFDDLVFRVERVR
jgi:hypothetical protein